MKKNNTEGPKKRNENDNVEVEDIINGVLDPLFVLDKDQKVLRVNKAACEVFEKKGSDFIGKHCYEVVHGTNHPFPGCPAIRSLATKQPVSVEIEDTNLGIPMQITTSPTLDEYGEVTQIIHTAKNISQLKAALTEIQIAANLFETVSDSILVHDIEGNIIYFNKAAYESRGYTKEEFQALSIQDIEGNLDFFGDRVNELIKKGELTFDTVNLCKDKTVFPVEIHAQLIESDDRKLILTVARDITERKKNELILKDSSRKIEEMNEKLRVVGNLTRHDVRNKLAAITIYTYLLKKKHGDQPGIMNTLSAMDHAVSQSVKIFDFAKMYEQLGVEQLYFIDVEQAINEASALLFDKPSIKVNNECHGLSLLADSFLRQMFYNLMDNSRKHGQRVTEIKISYENTCGDILRVIYQDNGVGISQDNKSNLFRGVFTTSESTGYGLFLIKKMMDIYGWEIQENGEEGKGVNFVIKIPLKNRLETLNYQIK